MAKSFLSIAKKVIKAAEKDRVRQAAAAARNAKAHEASLKRAAITNERDRIAHEKALNAAHIASQLAEVDRLNSEIDSIFEDLGRLLEDTISKDDYVDLDSLRKSEKTTPFDRPDLEVPLARPTPPKLPAEPKYVEPPKPKGFFGKKRKIEEAKLRAQLVYESAKTEWMKSIAALQEKHKKSVDLYEETEARRVETLARERARFQDELQAHNQSLDQFISHLSYGDSTAVQEYISVVVQNSVYPDHFKVSHDFTFLPDVAELRMKVSITAPEGFPSIKSYKYVKATDEIAPVALSKAEFKALYSSALYQVAIRSLHEVYEADRRGLINTISLEVGADGNDPATGKAGFIPFVGVGAARESFTGFDLSRLVPLATLQHLGASISKDPISLVAANVGGVRKS